MKIPKLHEDRELAEKQRKALYSLMSCKERESTYLRQRLEQVEKQLSLVDKTEIDALRYENERLTNLLENLEQGNEMEPFWCGVVLVIYIIIHVFVLGYMIGSHTATNDHMKRIYSLQDEVNKEKLLRKLCTSEDNK